MGYICLNHPKRKGRVYYKEISPKVWECPICKQRYHEFGYEEEPILYGDYCNIRLRCG